jgi:hypothetical protein
MTALPVYMAADEIRMIEGYLTRNMTVLEWGCGGSTLHFSPLVNAWVSIEHDLEWYKTVKGAHGRPRWAHLIWEPVADDSDPWGKYVAAGTQLANIDAVLIDGRQRLRCARAILPYITRDTIVFFHDMLNPERVDRYLDVLRDYEIIDHVPWRPGGGGSLAVLRKRLT